MIPCEILKNIWIKVCISKIHFYLLSKILLLNSYINVLGRVGSYIMQNRFPEYHFKVWFHHYKDKTLEKYIRIFIFKSPKNVIYRISIKNVY